MNSNNTTIIKEYKTVKTPIGVFKRSTFIFYTVIISLLVLAITASVIIGLVLKDFLKYYESSRAEHVAEEYFQELFLSDDYEKLYGVIGFQEETNPVSVSDFDLWLKGYIGERSIDYVQVSAGLSGDNRYVVYMEDQEIKTKLGEFYISPAGIKDEKGNEIYEGSKAELTFPHEDALNIRVRKGSVVTVNGKKLGDGFISESGRLMEEDFVIYTVNCILGEYDLKATFNGEDVYLLSGENSKKYSDEIFGMLADEDVTTVIRAVKGHTVYVEGKPLGNEYLMPKATGEIKGYYLGNDRLCWVMWSVSGKKTDIKIKDQEGNEQELLKLSGTNIYTDVTIDRSGKIELYALQTSKITLSGLDIPESLITEKGLPTKHTAHMPSGTVGMLYNKYTVNWVGVEPELSVIDKYGNRSELIADENGDLKEKLVNDPEAVKKHEELLIEATCSFVLAMSDDGEAEKALAHFDPSSQLYNQVERLLESNFSWHTGYELKDIVTSELHSHGEGVFSGRISLTEIIKKPKDENYEIHFDYTFYFKEVNGKYLIYEMVNEQ